MSSSTPTIPKRPEVSKTTILSKKSEVPKKVEIKKKLYRTSYYDSDSDDERRNSYDDYDDYGDYDEEIQEDDRPSYEGDIDRFFMEKKYSDYISKVYRIIDFVQEGKKITIEGKRQFIRFLVNFIFNIEMIIPNLNMDLIFKQESIKELSHKLYENLNKDQVPEFFEEENEIIEILSNNKLYFKENEEETPYIDTSNEDIMIDYENSSQILGSKSIEGLVRFMNTIRKFYREEIVDKNTVYKLFIYINIFSNYVKEYITTRTQKIKVYNIPSYPRSIFFEVPKLVVDYYEPVFNLWSKMMFECFGKYNPIMSDVYVFVSRDFIFEKEPGKELIIDFEINPYQFSQIYIKYIFHLSFSFYYDEDDYGKIIYRDFCAPSSLRETHYFRDTMKAYFEYQSKIYYSNNILGIDMHQKGMTLESFTRLVSVFSYLGFNTESVVNSLGPISYNTDLLKMSFISQPELYDNDAFIKRLSEVSEESSGNIYEGIAALFETNDIPDIHQSNINRAIFLYNAVRGLNINLIFRKDLVNYIRNLQKEPIEWAGPLFGSYISENNYQMALFCSHLEKGKIGSVRFIEGHSVYFHTHPAPSYKSKMIDYSPPSDVDYAVDIFYSIFGGFSNIRTTMDNSLLSLVFTNEGIYSYTLSLQMFDILKLLSANDKTRPYFLRLIFVTMYYLIVALQSYYGNYILMKEFIAMFAKTDIKNILYYFKNLNMDSFKYFDVHMEDEKMTPEIKQEFEKATGGKEKGFGNIQRNINISPTIMNGLKQIALSDPKILEIFRKILSINASDEIFNDLYKLLNDDLYDLYSNYEEICKEIGTEYYSIEDFISLNIVSVNIYDYEEDGDTIISYRNKIGIKTLQDNLDKTPAYNYLYASQQKTYGSEPKSIREIIPTGIVDFTKTIPSVSCESGITNNMIDGKIKIIS